MLSRQTCKTLVLSILDVLEGGDKKTKSTRIENENLVFKLHCLNVHSLRIQIN